MCDQLSNPIQFIINHIKSWFEDHTDKIICNNLYQEYFT